MNGVFQLVLQVRFAGVGVGGVDEVVDSAEKVGAVAGSHQLLGGLGSSLPIVIGHAARCIAETAFAGAEECFPLFWDFSGFVFTRGVSGWRAAIQMKSRRGLVAGLVRAVRAG